MQDTIILQDRVLVPKGEEDKFPSLEPVRDRRWIKYTDQSITLGHSTLVSGVRRNSKVRWYSWENDDIHKIVEKNGRLQAYSATGQRKKRFIRSGLNSYRNFVNVSNIYLNAHWFNASEMPDFIAERLMQHHQTALDRNAMTGWVRSLPLANLFEQDQIGTSIGFSDLQSADAREFVSRVYGKSRYRKDLAKAAMGSTLAENIFASQFRGLVPEDWIIQFLRNHTPEAREALGRNIARYPYREISLTSLRPALKIMDERSRRNLLFSDEQIDTPSVFDSVRFFWQQRAMDVRYGGQEIIERRIGGRRYQSWADVHDRLWGAGRVREIYREPVIKVHKPIELTAEALRIKNAFQGNSEYLLTLPESTETMEQWSDYMGNCIAGYSEVAARGDGVYGAVHLANAPEKILANFEVKNGRLMQLLAKHNQNLAVEHLNGIMPLLQSAGIDTDNFWGDAPLGRKPEFPTVEAVQIMPWDLQVPPVEAVPNVGIMPF